MGSLPPLYKQTLNFYMKKIIAINRIQSVSEEYILVSSSHGRMMYWNYKGTMEELKQKLLRIDVKIA